VSFLDPYDRNRRISLLGWMRLAFWAVLLAIAALLWWWLA